MNIITSGGPMKSTKKVLLTMFILAGINIPSMAQITFGSWGRAVITPLAFSGENSAVSAATSTWGDVPRIGFSANGTAPSGNIGFNLDFDFGIDITNNNNIAIIGDNAKAWVKPLGMVLPERFNMLKFTAGWFKEDELRGKIGATEFASWLLPNGGKNEDSIFTRFDASAGAHFRLEPLLWLDSPWNGLTIQGAFGSNAIGAPGNGLRAILNLYNNEANTTNNIKEFLYNEDHDTWDGERKTSALDVYKAGQYALSYRIPDIGLTRFQFIGNNREVFRWPTITSAGITLDEQKLLVAGINTGSPEKSADIFEFAFLYDSISGLKVDAGVKIPLSYTTTIDFVIYDRVFYGNKAEAIERGQLRKEYTVQLPYSTAVGADWTPSFLPGLNIMARLDMSFGGKIERSEENISIENGFGLNAWLVPSYEVFPNFKAGLDLGIDVHARDKVVYNGAPYNDEDEAAEALAVSEYTDFGIGVWIELGVGGGKVRAGVVTMLPDKPRYKVYEVSGTYYNNPKFLGDPVISIPISFTYSF
jgi:hypothetical protein